VGISERGAGYKEGVKEGEWWMYFVFGYENRRMKSVEIVPGSGERG
jgi:hypothetical protein